MTSAPSSEGPSGLVPHGEPAVYFTLRRLSALGLPHAMTTRHCPGLGADAGPRRSAAGASSPSAAAPFTAATVTALEGAGVDFSRAAWARQVHGAEAVRVRAPGAAGTADVLVTTARGLPLVIFTADCLAITLWDREAGALAVAHVGWRGTVRDATGAAVVAAVEAGGRPERLRAAIAPSIGPCCYEVDAPVVERFAAAHPARWEAWVRPGRPAHWMLDLWTANEALLRDAGVAADRIENPRLCTACHPDLLCSYRKGSRGRLATIAALP